MMQESSIRDATIRQFLALSSRYFFDGRASWGEDQNTSPEASSSALKNDTLTQPQRIEAALLAQKPKQ